MVPPGLEVLQPDESRIRCASGRRPFGIGRHPLAEALGKRSHILATLPVGLESLTSGTWSVFFGPIHLGWLDERDFRIPDRRGRSQRERHRSPIR